MRVETWVALERGFAEFPFLKGQPVEPREVDVVAGMVGQHFPNTYAEFLCRYGAAMVGPYPIFGVRPLEVLGTSWSVVERNQAYREDGWPGVAEWVVFSNDHAGNPFGFARDGVVWVSDHDFDQIVPIAADFEDFLWTKCKL